MIETVLVAVIAVLGTLLLVGVALAVLRRQRDMPVAMSEQLRADHLISLRTAATMQAMRDAVRQASRPAE